MSARTTVPTSWAKPSGISDHRDVGYGERKVVDCDVVVIGSGAGGAVVAAELAEAGHDVLVLEEGGYNPTESFTPEPTSTMRRMYRDGGAIMAIGNPPIVLSEGRTVGGSTVINGGMSWRTPERVLDRWYREELLDNIRMADMERHFDRVERFVSARHQDPETIGKDNAIMKRGADALGWDIVNNTRGQVHCAGANNCAFGCPTGAKQSMLVSYIPRALHFGARIQADCRVEKVLFHGKRAVGVSATITGPDGRRRAHLTVHARRAVVVACGALQTPALLDRSGFRSPSGWLGRGLTLHPNVKVVAIFDEDVEGWKGVHQGYQVKQFQHEGIMTMAAVNIPAALVSIGLPHYGAELAELMKDYKKMVVAGLLAEDTTHGRVRVIGGRSVPFYSLQDQDIERLIRGTALLCDLLFTAGAKRIVLPFDGQPHLFGPDDVRRIFSRQIPKSSIEVVTVHMMGTARMGGDPVRHVVDPQGQVYDTDRLYIADASLFPGAIGTNPAQTIMALATRNSEYLLERLGRREDRASRSSATPSSSERRAQA